MRKFLHILTLILATATIAQAQPISPPEVTRLTLSGNEELNDDQLLAVMRTRESPWGIWKFIYREVSEKLGQKPEYFDPIAFEADVAALRRLYESCGFFHARIDTQLQILQTGRRDVDVAIRITEGKRSFVDSVSYRGLADLPADILGPIENGKLLAPGDPFTLSTAEEEVRRVVGLFANGGYLGVRVDTVLAERLASTNNVRMLYSFVPGRRYLFGQIRVLQDSSAGQTIDEEVVVRHLGFKEGDYYSESKKIESERNLNRLGVFETAKIENAVMDVNPESTILPVRISVRARPFQELTPEIGVSDENNAFNILTGFGYNHRNFFGGARSFTARLRVNIQSIQTDRFNKVFSQEGLRDSTIVAKTELSAQLLQPFFLNNKTSVSITLSGILDKQRSYYLPILRSRVGVIAQTATYTRTYIDWNLELMEPKTVTTQQDTALDKDYIQKQFNSIITLTIQRDKRNDIFSPSEGFLHSFSLEESGIIPRLFGRPLGITLPYSQYIKANVIGQWYWDATEEKDWIWALRLRGGAAYLYGNETIEMPLTQRFFGGGSGSVRGWKARDLGAFARPDFGGRALLEANFEGRWNLLRGVGSLWFIELEKFSVVFFADAGNTWFEPKDIHADQVAVAAGFGIRYNTVAGPIRIDLGMRVFDPSAPSGREWITSRKFVSEVLSGGVIHLGVGHAF